MVSTTKHWTVEELERPGAPDGRYELIDGEIVPVSPTSNKSSRVTNTFAFFITGHVRPLGLGEVFSAEAGFVLFPGRQLIRSPDVAFVRADRLPPESEWDKFPRLAPDLVVEVISPSDPRADVLDKVAMWLAAGVRLLWLADPAAVTVTVHAPDREPVLLAHGDDLYGGDVLPGFQVPIAELFA